MKSVYFLSTIFVFLFSLSAQARIFNYKEGWFNAYLRFTGGLSTVDNSTYSDTSGNLSNHGSDGPDYNLTGELGFIIQPSEKFSFRLGFEGIKTSSFSTSSNSKIFTQQKHMDIDSEVSAFNPNMNLEFTYAQHGNGRIYGFLGAGMAKVRVKNEYTMSGLGDVDYGTTRSSYKDVWEADAISYQVGAGYEMHAFDNVTFNIEGGYRMLDVSGFTYEDTHSKLVGSGEGTVNSGAKVIGESGKGASVDMSGPFIGIMIRFYLPPL